MRDADNNEIREGDTLIRASTGRLGYAKRIVNDSRGGEIITVEERDYRGSGWRTGSTYSQVNFMKSSWRKQQIS
jgi:hypothetical protein